MDFSHDGTIQQAVNHAAKEQERYCRQRLVELNLPETIMTQKRISKVEFPDVDNYYEYILDIQTPQRKFIFAEILQVETKGKEFFLKQILMDEPLSPEQVKVKLEGQEN